MCAQVYLSTIYVSNIGSVVCAQTLKHLCVLSHHYMIGCRAIKYIRMKFPVIEHTLEYVNGEQNKYIIKKKKKKRETIPMREDVDVNTISNIIIESFCVQDNITCVRGTKSFWFMSFFPLLAFTLGCEAISWQIRRSNIFSFIRLLNAKINTHTYIIMGPRHQRIFVSHSCFLWFLSFSSGNWSFMRSPALLISFCQWFDD